MNITLIKQSTILSLIFGGILGVIAIIPFIGLLAFLTMMFASASLIMIYMHKQNQMGLLIPKDAAILSSLIGFASCIGFCTTMIPIAALIALANHLWFHKLVWYASIGIWFSYGIAGIIVLVFMVIFVAIIAALMNACAGLGTAYVYGQIINKEETNETFFIDN